MITRLTRPWPVALIPLLLLAGAVAALGQRDSEGTSRVDVCIKANGQLRVVTAPGGTCDASESPMRWVVGGEITAISAGSGLLGNRHEDSFELALDPVVFEACRACRGGGTFAAFDDGPEALPTNLAKEPIAQLDLPAGSYSILAKMTVENGVTEDAGAHNDHVSCRLAAGADFDDSRITVPESASFLPSHGLLEAHVVHVFTEPGAVVLSCTATPNDELSYQNLKFVATETSHISNGPLMK